MTDERLQQSGGSPAHSTVTRFIAEDVKIVKTTLPWAWLLLATLNSGVLVLWENEALSVYSNQVNGFWS